jgi:hypothetical protein
MLTIMMLSLIKQCLNSRLSERPSAGIEGFFLTPDDGFGVRVLVEILLKLLPGEGIELLDTGDGRVFDALIGTVLVESSINLSSAKDDTVNLVGVVDGVTVLWVRDDPLELGITSELLDRRAGERMAEERLGEEENQSCEMLAFLPLSEQEDSRFRNCLFICLLKM